MLKVGLTGGFASGKSVVAATLEEMGCRLIHADRLGHEMIAPGGPAYQPVIEEFGAGILAPGGEIDRRKLASLVFTDPLRLEKLNTFIHPHVFRREEEMIAAFAAAEPSAIIVVEAAIMIETGSYKRYQKLILAVCPEEIQIERAMKRDGIGREDARARIRRQLPLAEKMPLADYIIDTSGDKANTITQTQAVYESLLRISLRSDPQ